MILYNVYIKKHSEEVSRINTDWTELIFIVSAADARQAEGLLACCSERGVYVEDYSDMEAMLPLVGAADYVSEELTAKNRSSAAIHLYVDSHGSTEQVFEHAQSALKNAGIKFEHSSAVLPDADWASDWKSRHKPHRVGNRLVLCPSWESWLAKPGDVVLTIDPGGAFGSGEDITTTLCLQMLEEQLSGGERLLDIGCGSGILSIAALLLGADTALGVDIEERVLREAPENARINGVSTRFSAACGNVLTDGRFSGFVGEGFDLICGNIVADVQLSMARIYSAKLRRGGKLVISGVLDTRAAEVRAAMNAAGLSPLAEICEREWCAFAYMKQM